MTILIRNTFANLAGNLLVPICSLLFIPIYIKYLGLEGYGFIGFFTILISLLGILTNGFGAAFQREIAIRGNSVEHRRTLRRLVNSFELAYWAAGFLLALFLISISGRISADWVNIENISNDTVKLCVMLVSLRIAVTFPNSIYQAVLLGTQRQVLNNILKSITAIISVLSGVVVVVIWKSIIGFYAIDVFNATWTLLLFRHWAKEVLPPKNESIGSNFEWIEIKNLLFLSLGLIWTNGIGVIVSQTDRIIISKLLPMASLGVYNIAVAGSVPLNVISNAIFAAFYPQICLTSQKDSKREFSFYLIYASKLVMIPCMVLGLPLIFFSSDIIEIWTRNEVAMAEAPSVMIFYILGVIFISYASVLYMGQTALGIMRFGVFYNTIALLWFPLAAWVLVTNLGLAGSAIGWMFYSLLGWIFHIGAIHIILKNDFSMYDYMKSIMLTSISAIAINYLSRNLALLYFPGSALWRILVGGIGGIITFLICYIICFGFHIPKEINETIAKLKDKLISMNNEG